jgi:hypothetical protein
MDNYSTRDVLADAKRNSPTWFFYPSALGALIWGIAVFWVLDRPGLSDSTRTLWEILPWPFLVIAAVAWIARERRVDEVSRAVSERAAYFTWHFTFFGFMAMTLLEASGIEVAWRDAFIWPALLHFFTWMWIHKRTVGI